MLKNDSNPDSQKKQQLISFYSDDLMRWLTAGWLFDDDPCACDESEASE